MVKHADLLVCDSKNIEQYIQEDISNINQRPPILPMGQIQLLQSWKQKMPKFGIGIRKKELAKMAII